MTWNGYTVFSALSGVILILGGLAAPRLSAKDRIFGLIGGAFFLGYGLFVGHQTSGTYAFPVYIFIVPPLAVVYAVLTVVRGRASAPRTGSGQAAQPGMSAATGQGAAAQQSQGQLPAAWAPPPPPPGSQPQPMSGDDLPAGS